MKFSTINDKSFSGATFVVPETSITKKLNEKDLLNFLYNKVWNIQNGDDSNNKIIVIDLKDKSKRKIYKEINSAASITDCPTIRMSKNVPIGECSLNYALLETIHNLNDSLQYSTGYKNCKDFRDKVNKFKCDIIKKYFKSLYSAWFSKDIRFIVFIYPNFEEEIESDDKTIEYHGKYFYILYRLSKYLKCRMNSLIGTKDWY